MELERFKHFSEISQMIWGELPILCAPDAEKRHMDRQDDFVLPTI